MTSIPQTSRRRNGGFPASMSITTDAPYSTPIERFLGHPGSVAERLLPYSFTNIIQTVPHTPYNTPQSTSSVSHMTPAQIHQPYHTSTSVPSLVATSTFDSVSTSLASTRNLASQPQLEEVDGVLEQPALPTTVPLHRCVFWFLNCAYSSRDYTEWQGHCTAHLRGVTPPSRVQCGLCTWDLTCESGVEAWQQKLRHLSTSHFMSGDILDERSRKELYLYQWLWQKKLIADEDFKALKSGCPIGNFVTTGRGPRRERGMRERSAGMGLQHVTPRQRT